MVLALISAVAYSFQSLLAAKLGSTETALGMTFYSQLAFISLSGLTGLLFGSGWLDDFSHPSAQYLFRAWTVPTPEQAWLIVEIGVIAAVGFLCISQAYRIAEANVVAPFEYSSLPFAVFWGWLFWQAIPGLPTVLGSLIIVASGLYALHHQVVLQRSTRAAAASVQTDDSAQ